jgi:hypothetical protein
VRVHPDGFEPLLPDEPRKNFPTLDRGGRQDGRQANK